MCGIVGLFTKTPKLQSKLGDYLSSMLIEMSDRGPDSAGVAFYRQPAPSGATKLSLFAADPDYGWKGLLGELQRELGDRASLEVRGSHAVVVVHEPFETIAAWLAQNRPELKIVSAGDTIEIFKEKGLPREVVERFDLRQVAGSHALGHTRMATESAVTTEHSHPFSTGMDLCLVHNGSLSNHNRLRQKLKREGIVFGTDNDSEVAAGYLAWRLREGDSLEQAVERGFTDLDGFYTFAIGTRDGFAVVRDPIACKHAVLAETDDWVAMATEYRAIAVLPGVEHAKIWEPEPGTCLCLEPRDRHERSGPQRRPARTQPAPAGAAGPTTNERGVAGDEPRGRPFRRRRADAADQGDDRRPRRLLLRRHEQGGGDPGTGPRRPRGGGEHDVGQGAGDRQRLPGGRCLGPRRPAGDRGLDLLALRHLDEGHRHRRRRLGRSHVGLHGAERQPGGVRRCRRQPRRLAL